MKERAENFEYAEPNDIACRFGVKAGFRLIDFVQVALPVFIVPIDAIVIASKPLQLVDEFLIRSIDEGVNTHEEVSGFLGLETVFVKKRLGELIGQDLLSYGHVKNGKPIAELTAKGREALNKAQIVQPKRQSFTLSIDGITRQALIGRSDKLLAGRDVRAFGLFEIRAFPDDKAPEFSEIAQLDLTAALATGHKKDKNIQRVMSMVHMGKRLRRYREATMLIFRAEQGRQIQVEFFIDGRPSPKLNESFVYHDGVKALHIYQQVEKSVTRTEQEIQEVLPNLIQGKVSDEVATKRPEIQKIVKHVGILESKIEINEASIDEAKSKKEIELLKSQLEELKTAKQNAEKQLNSLETRFLEVHEHRPLFERSLQDAKQRLLIVSPWIRDMVLNNTRLQKIKQLLEKGVHVFIAYGLGEDNKVGRDKGHHAIKTLDELARRYENMHFHELGDTHAKILLMDQIYAVIGSFNWLSFEGSSRRDFREEMSFRVNEKEVIEGLFQRYLSRFKK